MYVNIYEAKTNLSKYIEMVLSGKEEDIVIAKNGKPVARIVPFRASPVADRIGLAKGKLPELDYDAFQALDAEIATTFEGGELG